MAKIKFRRDTAAAWTEANPTLAQGEPGFEYDTGLLKIGDGASDWNTLNYSAGGGATLIDSGDVVVSAGSTTHWVATQRRNNENTEPRGLRYDSNGNLYALTRTYVDGEGDIAVITKYTAAGAVSWQKSFTNTYPVALAVDSSDCAYITVSTGDPDITVMKFNASGTIILWKKKYNIGNIAAYSAFIEEKSSTTLALAFTLEDGTPGPNIVVVMEINSTTGAVEIKRQISFASETNAVQVAGIDVDPDENVFVTGYYFDPVDEVDKMFIEKLDEDLGRVWSKSLETINGYDMYGGDCASDALGNIYAVGTYEVDTVSAESGITSRSAGILTKLNSLGVVQWTRRLGPGPCGGFAAGLTVTSTGDVYLSATTYDKNTNGDVANYPDFVQEALGANKMIVCRYNTQGAVIWQRYVDVTNLYEDYDTENLRGQAVALFGDKFAVSGYGYSWNTTPFNFGGSADNEADYFMAQLPTDGTALTIGNLNFTESRVPARFITHTASDSPLDNIAWTTAVTLEDSTTVADAEPRIANSIVKSETYEYTFGADGTLAIPNDGDLKLTQSQVGYLMAIGGSINDNDNVYSRALTVDSQGNMYVVGQEDDNYESFVVKIGPDGVRQWGVTVEENSDGYSNRANGVSIHPTTGNVMVVCEINYNDVSSVIITLDQDTGRILDVPEEYGDAGTDVYLVDLAYTSNGTPVVVGSKFGEFVTDIPVTKQTGSATGTILILRSAISGVPDSAWQIGGTGFGAFETIAYAERYTELTGTVRQGTGAEFNITKNSGSAGTTYTSSSFGSNGLVVVGEPGVAYIAAQKVDWTTPADYDTFEALPIGTVFTVSTGGGPQTFTSNNKSNDPGVDVSWTGTWASSTEGLNEVPISVTFGATADTYSAIVANGGVNYLPGHKIKILGTSLGGTTPANDAVITVESLEDTSINIFNIAGTPNAAASGPYTGVTGTNYQTGSGLEIELTRDPSSSSYNSYYSRGITSAGSDYVAGDVIVVPGTSLGGATPANDLTVTVESASDGTVDYLGNFAGTGQSTTWKLETTTPVDFSAAGSWLISYPLDRQNFVATPTWQRTFGTDGNATDRLYAVAVDTSNNIIAVGEGYGELATGDYRGLAMVYQFNSTGTLQWARQLNERNDNCYAKSVTTIGTDIYVTHESSDDGETVVTKLDSTGTVKWQRITGSGDDSVIARTQDGNLLVSVEAYNIERDEGGLKVFLLTPSGETVYKRWLHAATDQGTYFKNGRGLAVDGDSFYITGYFYANNNNSSLVARLPIDGTGTGEYGSFSYTDVNAMEGSFGPDGLTDTNYDILEVDLDDVNNYAGVLANNTQPYVNSTGTVTIGEGDVSVDSHYPDLTTETVRDTDGGNIVFPDGTTQNTSATDIPQRRFTGQRYTLGLKDRGHHILCEDSDDSIVIPYAARVEFPLGAVITFVNTSGGSVSIIQEGSSIGLVAAGIGSDVGGVALANNGIATLLNIGLDQWIISGNITTGP